MGRTKNELVYFIWNCAMDAAISTQDIKSACAKLPASLTRSIGSFISNYVILRDPKRNNIRISIEKRFQALILSCMCLLLSWCWKAKKKQNHEFGVLVQRVNSGVVSSWLRKRSESSFKAHSRNSPRRDNNFWADETRHGGRLLASQVDLGQNQFTRHGEQISRYGELVKEIFTSLLAMASRFLAMAS
ncbi:hypothetical protein QL285_086844 [Trifolium repens]|nr:hypothetical protein QL285_086844 [Trifolium repens]